MTQKNQGGSTPKPSPIIKHSDGASTPKQPVRPKPSPITPKKK